MPRRRTPRSNDIDGADAPPTPNAQLLGSHRRLSRRGRVLKAQLIGGDVDSSAINESHARSPGSKTFGVTGIIEPPYDPEFLGSMLEVSSALRCCVDAYVTALDAFGHRFEPAVDLDAADAEDRIRNAMRVERMRMKDDPETKGDPEVQALELEPTDDEVTEKVEELTSVMQAERSRLTNFFDFVCPDMSFVSLRRRTRQDVELTGNGYWEIVRNFGGDVAQFVFMPSWSVRIMPEMTDPIWVEERIKTSDIGFDTVKMQRRFHTYVQVIDHKKTYFKELGDPRVINAKNGRVVADRDALQGDPEATELIHFKIPSPRSAYGVPRWIGALANLLGIKSQERVNLDYFCNKGVPPLAIIANGTHVTDDTIGHIEDAIEHEIQGEGNFHKILLIEGEPEDGEGDVGRSHLEIKELAGSIFKDGLFMKYHERAMDSVGQQFRLPRLLRGDVRDFNRATATAALEFAEMQVFAPEREEFDFIINRKILVALGIKLTRFVSNAPKARDPQAIVEMVERSVKAGVLTPREGRALLEQAFGHEFKDIEASWMDTPPLTYQAELRAGMSKRKAVESTEKDEASDIEQEARRLLTLRKRLLDREAKDAGERLHPSAPNGRVNGASPSVDG